MLKTNLYSLSKFFTPLTLSFIAITMTLLVSLLAPEIGFACDLGGGNGCGGGY